MASGRVAVEPGSGPHTSILLPKESRCSDSEGGGEVQDEITQLRRDLMKSQGEAKLWKEEAEKIQMEYINFQSRSSDDAIAGAELDASRLKLEHAQGKLESKEDLPKVKHSTGSPTEDVNLIEALRSEIDLSQKEINRMKDVHRDQEKLVESLRAVIGQLGSAYPSNGLHSNTSANHATLLEKYVRGKRQAADLESQLKSTQEELVRVRSASEQQESKLKAEIASLLLAHDHATATQLDRELNVERPTDAITSQEVVRKVEALNKAISQAAEFIGKMLIFEASKSDGDTLMAREVASTSVYEEASRVLNSESLAHSLRAESAKRLQSLRVAEKPLDPLLVQMIMRIVLATWCYHFGCKWTCSNGGGKGGTGKARDIWNQEAEDRFIAELYEAICGHESQSVAGQWRSTAKAYVPFSTAGWVDALMGSIFSVMKIAGWTTRPGEAVDPLRTRMALIVALLTELREAMGEDVISVNLEIVGINEEASFNRASMENAYSVGSTISLFNRRRKVAGPGPEVVLGTVGLGLLSTTAAGSGMGVSAGRRSTLLLKPNVLLARSIHELLAPGSPPNTRISSTSSIFSELSLRYT